MLKQKKQNTVLMFYQNQFQANKFIQNQCKNTEKMKKDYSSNASGGAFYGLAQLAHGSPLYLIH